VKVDVGTTAEADQHIRAASAWWQANRPAAPDLFAHELARAFTLLADAPDVGRPYHLRSIPGLRRLLLTASKYHVYYVHDSARQRVLTLAIWSAVRGRRPPLRAPAA